MKDKLKGFIQENPEAADIYETDFESLWADIETQKNTGKTKSTTKKEIAGKQWLWRPFLSKAALWLVGLLMGGAMALYVAGRQADAGGFAQAGRVSEIETYYNGLIMEKTARIQEANPEIQKLFDMEMQEIDLAFIELKEDLKDDVSNEEVIDAMVKSYRLKLKILEELLNNIDAQKNENNL